MTKCPQAFPFYILFFSQMSYFIIKLQAGLDVILGVAMQNKYFDNIMTLYLLLKVESEEVSEYILTSSE